MCVIRTGKEGETGLIEIQNVSYAYEDAAAKALKEAGIAKLPNLYALKTEYKKLDIERERLSAQYSEAKQKLKEYGIVKQNVDSILRTAPGKEHTQER